MPEALFEISKQLCDSFHGLDPIMLLDYPAEDVFQLINDLLAYNRRKETGMGKQNDGNVAVRRKAGDDWF